MCGKAHQLPFSKSTTHYNVPLALVYIDIWGPSPVCASNGTRYYISFMDAYTKYTWLFLLHHKSQALTAFTRFKNFAETQTGHTLKAIQTDNAKEFLCFKNITHTLGIHHRLICPHTHEQNGTIERKNRHITEMGLTLLAAATLPIKFWGEAFTSAMHIINALPSSVLSNKSPYEMLF